MAGYDHRAIEQRWQAFWDENATFATPADRTRPKFYVLDMFPYPSGVGLHVGHPKGYVATDVVARAKRMLGSRLPRKLETVIICVCLLKVTLMGGIMPPEPQPDMR